MSDTVLIPSSSGLRFELVWPSRFTEPSDVLIPSSSGLRFECEPPPEVVPEHAVLIPSSSGLRFEWLLLSDRAPHFSLNPFFIRSAV